MTNNRGVALAAGILLLAGCGGGSAEPGPEATPPIAVAEEGAADEAGADQTDPASETKRTQDESCAWDDAASPSTSRPGIPSGQEGTLQEIIIGAWQHTHVDSGGGYTPIEDEDIRYVFPSSKRMLYCQHVPGITEHRGNAAAIRWDGNKIVPPGGAPGFTVTAWDGDTMIWLNHMDSSSYLLQRR